LISLFAGGHCLITGAPGLAKTLLVRSIAQIFHLKFQRIQFTPDLMPADITGTEILEETGDGAGDAVRERADLRQRDPGRRDQPHAAQDAGRAAGGDAGASGHRRGVRYPLEEPFFVLATQNPIEMEGTYPLPERSSTASCSTC
jgi:MoxR-like ATPase